MAGPELVLLRFGVELLYLHGRQLITASVELQANYYLPNLEQPRSLSRNNATCGQHLAAKNSGRPN
jgi:hypothetical protein